MTTSLVVIDHDGAVPRGTAGELGTLARRLGDVHGVWFGTGAAQAATELGRYGVAVVHEVPVPDPGADLPGARAVALADLVRRTGARTVLLASTFANKETAALLALELDAGLVLDATGVEDDPSGPVWLQRPFAATWVLRGQVTRDVSVVTLAANAVPAEPVDDPSPSEVRTAEPTAPVPGVTVVDRHDRPTSDRPPVREAQVVVVGGRGTGGDFGPVEELADALGAAVGATRDATDEGWIDHAAMIGQTGTTIAPLLYVGAGVSGAVHHRGGMMASQVVVAVNADPDAEIFEVADIGVVGDLFTVLPEAAAQVRRHLRR